MTLGCITQIRGNFTVGIVRIDQKILYPVYFFLTNVFGDGNIFTSAEKVIPFP